MNLFLLPIAGHLADLRSLLGWTQDDLAKKIGVSRSYIVSMEKDPTRFDQITAMALFTAVKVDIDKRRKKLEELTVPDLRDPSLMPNYLTALSSTGLTAQFLSTAVTSFIAPVIGLSVDAAVTGAIDMVSKTKLVKKHGNTLAAAATVVALTTLIALYSSKSNPTKPLASPKDVHDLSIRSFEILEAKVREYLGVTKLSDAEFVRKIEEGQVLPIEDDMTEETAPST